MFFPQNATSSLWLTGSQIIRAVKLSWHIYMRPNLANAVTIFRGLLAFIILLIRLGLDSFLGLPLIGPFTFWGTVLAAILDKVDGWLAKWFGISSRLGEGLDRGVDKAFFATIFSFTWISMVTLLLQDPRLIVIGVIVLLVPVSLIEILLFSLGVIGTRMGWPIKSARSGKWKMVAECVTGSWWALFNDLKPLGLTTASDQFLWPMAILLLVTNILAVLSLMRYIMLYWPYFYDYWKERTRHPA